MDPRRAQVERNAHFSRGPRFFREADAVMFEFVIDAGNVIGPRPATARDRSEHSAAYREFMSQDMQEAMVVAPEPEIQTGPDIAADNTQGQPVGLLPRRRKSRDPAA